MGTKVYVLLEVANGNKANMAAILEEMPGIALVDMLEGPPDLLTVIEARDRQKAAKHLMEVLNMVEGVVEDIQVLPVRESPEQSEEPAGDFEENCPAFASDDMPETLEPINT